jgi:ubiquitin-like protein ATG12
MLKNMNSINTNIDDTECTPTSPTDVSIATESDDTSRICDSQPVTTTTTTTTAAAAASAESAVVPKVKIHFVAVGSAPILKRNKFQINADQRFASVHLFLRKLLKLSSPVPMDENQESLSANTSTSQLSSNNLFLYCHSAFVPSPDHLIGELRESFAVRDELVVHYSLQEAWG